MRETLYLDSANKVIKLTDLALIDSDSEVRVTPIRYWLSADRAFERFICSET